MTDGFDIPVGNWLQVTVLCELARLYRVFSCSVGPCRVFEEEPQRPATPSTHSPYSSGFYNLMPRPFVCRKHALRRGSELAEAHLEVPELGFPCSSGLTLVCRVASNSPPWDRQVEISFPSPASCENIIKHPWRSLPLLTRGKKNVYKPQSLITHYKHETPRAIAQGGEMPRCSSPAGWVASPLRRPARSCCSMQAALQRPTRLHRRGSLCCACRCTGGAVVPGVPGRAAASRPFPLACRLQLHGLCRGLNLASWAVILYGVRWGFWGGFGLNV